MADVSIQFNNNCGRINKLIITTNIINRINTTSPNQLVPLHCQYISVIVGIDMTTQLVGVACAIKEAGSGPEWRLLAPPRMGRREGRAGRQNPDPHPPHFIVVYITAFYYFPLRVCVSGQVQTSSAV